jgi:hypothetical protein
MTALSGVFAPFVRPSLNIVFNSSADFALARVFQPLHAKNVAIVLAIDSIFRITAVNFLSLMKYSMNRGSWGQLSFLCITLLSQPASVYLARKLFHVQAPEPISLFGYIAASWKANMIVKELLFIFIPGLRG